VDLSLFTQTSDYEWRIAPTGAMRVPGIIYASEQLMRDMDHKVYEQVSNVASPDIGIEIWRRLAERINTIFASDAEVAGVVITHGTSTM